MSNKTFVICEKPSAGRDMASFLSKKYSLKATSNKSMAGFIDLGDEYTVGWCRGHLLSTVEPEEYDPNWKFWDDKHLPMIPVEFKVEPVTKKEKVNGKWVKTKDADILEKLKAIKACCSDADVIINAGDAGREGQVIVDEVLKYYNFLDSKTVKRFWANDNSEDGFEVAWKNMYENKNKLGTFIAGLVRAEIDWLFGLNLTRAISNNFKRAEVTKEQFSAGRVQTPVIFLLYQRDKQIKDFKEKDFYSLSASFTSENETFVGDLIKNEYLLKNDIFDEEERIIDKKFLEDVKQKVLDTKNGSIKSFSKKKKVSEHPKLYSLSQLQQEANKLLKISASQTLEIAQSLYEKAKMISYPRTSSCYLPVAQFNEIQKRVDSLSKSDTYKKLIDLTNGKYYKSKCWDDSKIGDHHAMIPIDFKANVYAGLSELEKKIYDMIVNRYICHLLPPKIEDETTILVKVDEYEFSSKYLKLIDSGWEKVYSINKTNQEDSKQKEISLKQGDSAVVVEANVMSKKTTPPSYFTEGTLIGAMTNISRFLPTENLTEEEIKSAKLILNKSEGLGTEATRAPLIDKLKAVSFMEVKNNNIVITNKGIDLIENLLKIGMGVICSPIVTARYEIMLKEIEDGKLTKDQFMKDFIVSLNEWVNLLKNNQFSSSGNYQSNNKVGAAKPLKKKV